MSYFLQPAKKASKIASASASGKPFNCVSIIEFNIAGWSTTIFQERVPSLSVWLYVYIGSGLPKKLVLLQLAEFVSPTCIS